MDSRIRIITIVASIAILLAILELVRRRKLKEEYSVLWVGTAFVVFVLSVWYGALNSLRSVLGADVPSSALFFCGLVFAILLLLHFSVRISHLERQLTALVQEVGLLSVREPDEPPARELPAAKDEHLRTAMPAPAEAGEQPRR